MLLDYDGTAHNGFHLKESDESTSRWDRNGKEGNDSQKRRLKLGKERKRVRSRGTGQDNRADSRFLRHAGVFESQKDARRVDRSRGGGQDARFGRGRSIAQALSMRDARRCGGDFHATQWLGLGPRVPIPFGRRIALFFVGRGIDGFYFSFHFHLEMDDPYVNNSVVGRRDLRASFKQIGSVVR